MAETQEANSPSGFSFGAFVLLPRKQRLLQNGVPVRIGGRALDILTTLVERPGDVVSKRHLMELVWRDVVVDESNLKVNMASLRRALGDSLDAPRFIATVTGRGYRFIAPVTTIGDTNQMPNPPAEVKRSHNLPVQLTSIFGRAEAIGSLAKELEQSRLISIVGPGGIGKTTVALAVAELSLNTLKDGVWLIDLATLKDPLLVPNAIATAVGLGGNSPAMLASLCEFLRGRELLLVLDSCEHVIDSAAACASQVLASAAGVRILATSREPLMLSGERVRRLSGLATPPSPAGMDAESALGYPAVQLFVERASERLESFRLNDADAPTVAEICKRLDGLALAIELAATRIDAFSVGGLLQQLDDRFSVLMGRRAGPERHRTLAATIDWSYGLLTVDEARLLRAVSVFSGAFDVEGAAAVGDVSRRDATEALAWLAAKSLISTEIDEDRITYRQLETTRSYCLERLQTDSEYQLIRQRHAEHLCALLERATAEWAQRPAGEWGALYGRAIDDLRVALTWAGRDLGNRSLRIRLTLSGILLWNHFSLTEECRVYVAQAVRELEEAGFAGTEFEMKLKVWLGGSTMFTQGLKVQAMDTLRRALEIAVHLGNTEYRLRCLIMIGIYELFTGEHEAGLRTVETFVACAAAEDPSVLTEGEVHCGIAELFLGRLRSARERLEGLEQRDLRYFGSYGVRYLADPRISVRSILTQVQWLTGSPDLALRTAAAALELAHQMGHHLSLNTMLSYACPIFYWRGDLEECDRHVSMLEEHVMRHGIVARRPVSSFYRAALNFSNSHASPENVAAIEQALEDFRRTNHLARMPYYLSVLADAQLRCGRLTDAQATIGTALAVASDQKEGWCLPEVLRVQASVLQAMEAPREAEAVLLQSIEQARRVSALSWELRAAIDLAQLWAQKPENARAVLGAVVRQFHDGLATQDVRRASAALRLLSPPGDGLITAETLRI